MFLAMGEWMIKFIVLLFCLLLPAVSSAANSKDHDAAKHLREAGKIVSLEKLLTDVHSRHGGRVLEIKLEKERDQYVYEIEMVDDAGKVHEYFYDAGDGHLLWEESKESETDK